MKSPFISRVIIKNYRNFLDLDVSLQHKGIIVGENNVGKTNFLKALQLILDPSLSDTDRMLTETDFNDAIEKLTENDCEITIQIYIDNFRNNPTVLAALADALIRIDEKELLKITYRFFPNVDSRGKKEYQYEIYMGDDRRKCFGSYERKYFNIRVIKALRDVDSELKNSRLSPIKRLLDEYEISKEDLETIAKEYHDVGERALGLDEIKDLTNNINGRFSEILGNHDFDVSLQAMEVSPNKVLSSLKVLMENRSSTDASLGLNNILYITMLLQLLRDKTVPTLLRKEEFDSLIMKDTESVLSECYEENQKGNYVLRDELDDDSNNKLYSFLAENAHQAHGTTVLAIEEPEAHLHPIYQRLIYRDVIKRNSTSVLLTTHSTHITAVSPISSLVHFYLKGNGSVAHSTALMPISEGEFLDVERYLDVKRGEIFLGKAVLLVEGVAEEYIIPRMAEKMGVSFDELGIVICNVNCTAFKPYMKLLNYLKIPYAVVTDGDFYIYSPDDSDSSKKVFHKSLKDCKNDDSYGYLGLDNMRNILSAMDENTGKDVSDDDLRNELKDRGVFVGKYTFEVDMMEESSGDSKHIFCDVYDKILPNRPQKSKNFRENLEKENYEFCLSRIGDNEVGKGRFAQIFAGQCDLDNCPGYIREAIEYLAAKVSR